MRLIPSSCHSQCHVYVIGQFDIHFDATEYLANEVALGGVAGSFYSPHLFPLHISSFGVLPKLGQPEGMVVDRRFILPGGSSV